MSNWDKLRDALRREKRDIKSAVSDFTAHANATLDAKEKELRATPSEKVAIELARAKELDDQIQALKNKIDRAGEGK